MAPVRCRMSLAVQHGCNVQREGGMYIKAPKHEKSDGACALQDVPGGAAWLHDGGGGHGDCPADCGTDRKSHAIPCASSFLLW
eukprot:591228-Pelagomonas_calceolata.AAC.5